MSKPRKAKKSKHGVPQEYVERIHAMRPEDVAVELSREQLAVETLKMQMKEDSAILEAQKIVEDMNSDVESQPDVVQAHQTYLEVLDTHKGTKEYEDATQTLKATKHSWNQDIRDRRKKIKFMMKTIRAHIESGALKLKP